MEVYNLTHKVCLELEGFLKHLPHSSNFQPSSDGSTTSGMLSLEEVADLQKEWDKTSASIRNLFMTESLASKKVENSVKWPRRRHACKTCRKQFANDKILQHHLRNVHLVEKGDWEQVEMEEDRQEVFSCCQLCYSCYRPDDLDAFRGHACKNSSSNNSSSIESLVLLQEHNRFTCGYCQEDFRQFRRILCHLAKCRGAPFACDVCQQKDFATKKSLIEHKINLHPNDLPFRCDQCPKRFKLNTSLQKHLHASHEKDEEKTKLFLCDMCDKRFKKRVFLTIHKTRCHDLFKPFLCQVCGERFVSNSGLQSHLEIHQSVKRFSCSVCHKSFRRKDKLELHSTTHTGLRPHHCDEEDCGKSFVSKSKLQEHQRRHMGEKRFSCRMCSKLYFSSSDLRVHLKKHHPRLGIKPLVPLATQIIPRRRELKKDQMDLMGDTCPFEIDIDDLRTANVAIRDLGFDPESLMVLSSDIL